MAAVVFRLPDIGEGVAEAEIVAWHVKQGDLVEEDQPLVDVMTDKATVEMTSPVAGVVMMRHGEVGSRVPVGSALVEFSATEADVALAPAVEPVRPPEPVAPRQTQPVPAAAPSAPAALPLASPATRRLAYERGINLQLVPGTGPAGRITRGDIESYTPAGALPAGPIRRTGVMQVKLAGIRRLIAERMQESKRRIPHFGYVEEFDMTELEQLRRELNAGQASDRPKLTLLPFFIRALVRTLPDFPNVNARFDDDVGILSVSDGVHVGIATQTDNGLTVPVIRHAETLGLWETARELQRVTKAARDGNAPRDLLTGSTITLTSLGALGGISATPVINRPEVAIIGPNKLVDRPVVIGGQIGVRAMMNVSTAFDHRIVDGHDAARFVHALKRLLEPPALLVVEPA